MQLTNRSFTLASIIFFSAHTCSHPKQKKIGTTFQLGYDIKAEDPSLSVQSWPYYTSYIDPGINPSNCRRENVKLQGKISFNCPIMQHFKSCNKKLRLVRYHQKNIYTAGITDTASIGLFFVLQLMLINKLCSSLQST